MDSITQAALGATVAAAVAPAGERRKALLLGAALGTLPDLDVFIDYGDAVSNFTYHRGFTHSLFVLAPLSLLLWALLRRLWPPVAEAPGRWLAAVALALLTHPLLDAHTAYGTQLFWPLASPPQMWGTLFIIDPLFTLPLLVATVLAVARPGAPRTGSGLQVALALCVAYLGWSWIAQGVVAHKTRTALAGTVEVRATFITPTPFNTLLWRIVVLTPDGYLEGLESLVIDDAPLTFTRHLANRETLEAAGSIPAVARLRWFSRDFLRADVIDGQLVLSDLRMGQEPLYVFRHAVAESNSPGFRAITPALLPASLGDRRLGEVWERIWSAD